MECYAAQSASSRFDVVGNEASVLMERFSRLNGCYMDNPKSYYVLLSVLPTAEPIVIRAAYRALAMKYHPDKWTGDKATAERRMREINQAYEILSDEQSRARYDGIRQNL